MLKNYIRIAFRNILRHKAYSIINIAGLAIGMSCSIMILLWVQHERSYDRFHKNADTIYRIVASAGEFKAAVTPVAMTPELQRQLPVIKNNVRTTQFHTVVLESGNRKFEEKHSLYVDSNFLEVFSFSLKRGNRQTALQRPDAILLTQSMAKKYFGTEDAIGKTLLRNNQSTVLVTGVLEDIPANSHLQFDFIMPLSAIAQSDYDVRTNNWGNFDFYSYVQLDKNFAATNASLSALSRQMDTIFKKNVKGDLKVAFHLQPLTRIHLYSDYQIDFPGNGNKQYVTIFFVVAIFILLVACINFMNLATARSARRAKEVGLRKVIGAVRIQLVAQFLGESVLISLFALLLSAGLVLLLLPLFNEVAGKKLAIQLLDGQFLLTMLGIAAGTGIIAGSYPALYLSGFRPVKVLKGNLKSPGGNQFFRNTLVVTQFIVSIVLLVGTVVVYNQLQFIKNRNLGFDKENLLYMPMTGDLWSKFSALKSELKQNPLTADFTYVNELPTALTTGTVEMDWEGKDPNLQVVVPSMDVSEDFIEVFRMTMLRGRDFGPEFKGDSNNYVVNEKMLQLMNLGLDDAVGNTLSFNDRKGTIIGVVKDFNFKPVQHSIEPLVVRLNTWGGNIIVRSKPGATEATIKAMEKISQQLNPAYPFSFNFIDQDIANLYTSEQRLGKLFNIFAVLAIFISCLGLYGLSAFMAEQRTKEIGVRKVLGASALNIVYLLSTGITRLIFIAMAIAIPVAWWSVHNWLQGFAYHININWMIFVIASLSALLIAWLTVSYESVKAAITNPIKSLRSE